MEIDPWGVETVTQDLAELLAKDLDTHFEDFVRSRQDRVYAGMLRLVRHPEDAADLTQETFVKAYRALSEYSALRIREMSLDAWVWTIALNLCRGKGRVKRPTLVPLEGAEPTARSAEQEAVTRIEGDRLVTGLRRLTPSQRETIVLHHVAGLSYREISEATGKPEGTLKSNVARGMQRLATILENEHD
jgi:RNA polymerase sigma-70 factor (ECF subfamily)